MNKLICIITWVFLPFLLSAQIEKAKVDQNLLLIENAQKIEAAKKEARLNGISEMELQNRLLEKGYDLNQLNESQLETLESAVNESLNELKKEKQSIIDKKEFDQKINQLKKNASKESDKLLPQTTERSKTISDQIEKKQTSKQEQAIFRSDSLKEKEEKGINEDVAIYGQQFFNVKNIQFYNNSNDVLPSNDYVLGSGDGLRVVVFGKSIFDGSYEIDNDGYIDPKSLPKIFLKGITFGAAKKLIESRFKQKYSFETGQIEVTLKKSRTILVGIFGEVKNPGSFSNPAVNSAYNLIAIADGLTNLASVRNIRIVSPGKTIRTYDVYKYMLTGEFSKSIYLDNNDFIQVPSSGKTVKIIGAINRPYRYELLEKESLTDLINFAGGYSPQADKSLIQVIRYENGARKIIEVKESEARQYIPKHGDEVTIIALSEEVKNIIEIIGEVERPGKFEWSQGLKLADILNKARLIRTSKLDIGYIERLNSDQTVSYILIRPSEAIINPSSDENKLLNAYDKLIIFAQKDFSNHYKVNSEGALRKPNTILFDPNGNMKVSDLINLSGGLLPDAIGKGFIVRTDTNTLKINYIIIDALEALLEPSSEQNILLQPLDRLVILSNKILFDELFVTIDGAVKIPGTYNYGEGLSLVNLIVNAGGFKLGAANNKIDIYRVVLKNNEPTRIVAASFEVSKGLLWDENPELQINLEPFDMIEVRSVPNFELQKRVKIEGEVKYPGNYALTIHNESLYDLINKAGGLSAEAFSSGASLIRNTDNYVGPVILELEKVMKNPSIAQNIALRDGDYIYIPKRQDLVHISGATNILEVFDSNLIGKSNQIVVSFLGNKNAKFYIDKYAGGISKNGDKSKIIVERANGRKEKTKTILFLKKYPKIHEGDKIIVGFKDAKTEKDTAAKDTDWNKIVTNSLAQITAILSLVVLVNAISK